MTAAFEVDRFEWDEGAFEVTGRWDGEPPSGRVRLVAQIDGRRRRMNAQSDDAPAAVGPWTVRFTCARRPEAVGDAELEVGGELVIVLPHPKVAPEPPPDVRGAEALLQQLREARTDLEAVAERLARERAAAEAIAERLASERDASERAVQEAAKRFSTEREASEKTAREAAQAVLAEAERAVREAAQAADAAAAAREQSERVAHDAAVEAAELARREVVSREDTEAMAPITLEEADAPGEPGPPAPATAAAGAPPPTEALPTARLPVTPRRPAIRDTLELPREPRGLGRPPADPSAAVRWIPYVLALLIVALIVVLALLLL